MFFLTVVFNENYHNYENLKDEGKFMTKQFFKIITGILFYLNVYELNGLINKSKVF